MSESIKEDVALKETASLEQCTVDPSAERRLSIKVDLHVVPILFVLFLLAFLDRINIGNARLQGLEESLNMTGHDYNIALFIFFIPYVLCEVPSNIFLKKIAPSTWLSGIIIAWGIITTCQGVVKNFAGLVVCRVLLGIFEAGFMPGAVYLISMYYPRHQVQTRINVFFSASIVAGAISGLLAYGISHMDGVGGYKSWRWLFILEGLVTVVVAIASKFLIVDWPETAKFLNDDERRMLLARLAKDNGEVKMDRLDKKAAKRCFTDPKIYLGVLMYFGVVNTGYATSFFVPTILNQMGYDSVRAQVMSIPVFAAATVITLTCALLSDHLKHRYAFSMLGVLVATVGYVLLIVQNSVVVGVRYFAVFAITVGGFISQPLVLGWLSNNMGGHYKRSVSSSMQIGFGNTGGLIASNVFLKEEAPLYPRGYGVSLALMWVCGMACTVFVLLLMRENKIRDAGGRDWRLELPEEEVGNLGDDHPSFRFTY
ncbi:hypothetical protein AJ79_02966 [Helicocarpus griseus UAMH5409]|uniref:Major facilitator superfamily (MFS) profile domain-containing protein n=1 Tax=Helicocarpus griseus UAMH5409 TaxID=1447875 RepID=A0A2B7Y0S0_9EURO|nr:hypothetical protein AJ79_02966 [Helicocarpus griseus UAMH5409]